MPATAQETNFDKAFDAENGIIRLNPNDETGKAMMNTRDMSNDNRPAGPIDLRRTEFAPSFAGIPTFFKSPVALTPEDLRAGNVDVAIMGVPMDNGGYGRLGTSWGPQTLRIAEPIMPGGPVAITTELQTNPFTEMTVVDYGDVPVDPNSIEASLPNIRRYAREVAETGAIPISVGGNHSILYPLILGMQDVYGPESFTLVHVDAHTDTSKENFGHYITIGNSMYLAVEEGIVKGTDSIQLGQRSPGYGPDKMDWFRENKVRIYFQPEFETRGFKTVLKDVIEDVKKGPGKIYISIDIDVLDPAVAGGVTAPVIGGWSTRQLMDTIKALAVSADVIGMDFVEYNPYMDDHARTTGAVTLNMIRESLTAIALRKKGITDPFYFHPDMLGATRSD
ncbi:agmatinase family protein [Tropicibacter sp. Alg240-R139]|uniref:agmatinase family protein n=1 Tax=Tropicibacter sp. Alg240-R139 TaxID=2305991 RepID=UPI0013E0D247|nr:agmatinase family protein [Tropicibacter sp. Alg240-R139]